MCNEIKCAVQENVQIGCTGDVHKAAVWMMGNNGCDYSLLYWVLWMLWCYEPIVSYAVVRNPRCCIIKKPNICSLAHSDRSAVDWCNARIDFCTKNTFSRHFELIPTLVPCHMIPASSMPWNICWQGRSVLNGRSTPNTPDIWLQTTHWRSRRWEKTL